MTLFPVVKRTLVICDMNDNRDKQNIIIGYY